MRSARLVGLVAALGLVFATPVHATDGGVCSGPGEPSFTCGFVIVTVQVGSDVNTVLAGCQPVGEVSDVSGRDFLISVPAGSEIAVRDCYAMQSGVSQANLLYAGGFTQDAAMRTRSGFGGIATGAALLSTGILLVTALWARSRRT